MPIYTHTSHSFHLFSKRSDGPKRLLISVGFRSISVKTCFLRVASDIRVAGRTKKRLPMLLSDLSSKNSLRVYWALGLAVGDGVVAGCGAKLRVVSMTLS